MTLESNGRLYRKSERGRLLGFQVENPDGTPFKTIYESLQKSGIPDDVIKKIYLELIPQEGADASELVNAAIIIAGTHNIRTNVDILDRKVTVPPSGLAKDRRNSLARILTRDEGFGGLIASPRLRYPDIVVDAHKIGDVSLDLEIQHQIRFAGSTPFKLANQA